MYSNIVHKQMCLLRQDNQNLLLVASYFRSYTVLIFEKNIYISDLLTILVCDMCYHANKSGNFNITRRKFNSFKKSEGGDIFLHIN